MSQYQDPGNHYYAQGVLDGASYERDRLIKLLIDLNAIRRDALGHLCAFNTHGTEVIYLPGLETPAPAQPKRCDCGNKIDPRELGEGATQCEWCEHPEVPIYKINQLGDGVLLCFVGQIGTGIEIQHSDKLRVTAPSQQAAELILNDYLAEVKARG
jgi:hypothetical protein